MISQWAVESIYSDLSYLFVCFSTLIFQWVKTSDPEETATQFEGDEMMYLGPEEAKFLGQKEAEEEAEHHFSAFDNQGCVVKPKRSMTQESLICRFLAGLTFINKLSYSL